MYSKIREACGILVTLTICFFVYCCMGILLKGSLFDTMAVSLWHIAGTILPGMALAALLSRKHAQYRIIEWLTISFALGYCANILSYFLFVPFQLQMLIPYWGIALTVGSLFVLVRSEFRFSVQKINRADMMGLACLTVCLGITYLCYSAYNAAPVSNVYPTYATDLMYWIENASALANSFLPMDPRVSVGETYYYHFFSSIQIAYVSLLSGADIFTLGTVFFALGKTVLCFGAFYLLLSRYSPKLQWFGLIAILFCTGLEEKSIVTYCHHLWINPFGFDIGYAFEALFLYCFLHQEENSFDFNNFLLCILFFAVCCGSKAPNALVILVIPGVICLKWLTEKEYTKAFGYGLSLLFIFALIMITCIGLFIASVGDGSMEISVPDGEKVLQTVVYSNPLIIGLFALCLGLFVLDKKVRSIVSIAASLCGFSGLLLGVIVTQDGHSEMYFTMSAFVPCLLFAAEVLDRYEWKHIVAKRTVATLAGFVMAGEIVSMLFVGYHGGIGQYAKKGLKNILCKDAVAQQFCDASSFTFADYDALAWVRDNTPRDSVLLSDRSVINKEDGFMYYGAFSERQQYLEGDRYFRDRYLEERTRRRLFIEKVFANDEDALKRIAEENIDYVIQTKRITPGFEGNSSILCLVYETSTVRIYDVVQ